MIIKNYTEEAQKFFENKKDNFLPIQKEVISRLENIDSASKLSDPEVAKYIKNKFVVKIS